MRYWITALFCCAQCGFAANGDPFNRESHANLPATTSALSFCHPEQSAVAPHRSLQQLRLIGIFKEKQQAEAWFIDEEKHIFSVKVGDFVATEKAQIHQIEKNQITLWLWKTQCDKPELIQRKL